MKEINFRFFFWLKKTEVISVNHVAGAGFTVEMCEKLKEALCRRTSSAAVKII